MSQNESKMKNREQFPNAALLVDEMREIFGEVQVHWVREGSIEKGKKGEEGIPLV
jgi:hypothetical protein